MFDPEKNVPTTKQIKFYGLSFFSKVKFRVRVVVHQLEILKTHWFSFKMTKILMSLFINFLKKLLFPVDIEFSSGDGFFSSCQSIYLKSTEKKQFSIIKFYSIKKLTDSNLSYRAI